MSSFSFANIALCAFAAATPDHVIKLDLSDRRIAKFAKQMGIEQVHLSISEQTPLDLGYVALTHALSQVKWAPTDLDLVIFATQGPDFCGGTGDASLLHHYLNLREDCAVFDLPLGCSAFPYSLTVACAMMECADDIKLVAVLNGDMIWNKFPNQEQLLAHKQHLFGEGTGAILLQKVTDSPAIKTKLFDNGHGYKQLFFYPSSRDLWHLNANQFKMPDGMKVDHIPGDITLNAYMDGMAIHEFSTTKIVDCIKEHYGNSIQDYDYYVFHQANKQILTTITERLGLDPNKVLVSLAQYGNTSAASALTTICHNLHDIDRPVHIFNASFGVGLSWGFSDFVIKPGTVSSIIATDHQLDEHRLKPVSEQ